ncbi:MAG: glycosyltransferase family 39 protein [Desulfoferrobacter sp.]
MWSKSNNEKTIITMNSKVDNISRDLKSFLESPLTVLAVIFFGIILRVSQYLANRSLWLDEAMAALNIIGRSFERLLQPLDYNQAAPPGFLLAEKAFVKIFGTNEYALRLLPLLFGIAALILFWEMARHYLEKRVLPVAILLFTVSDALIYYSSEVKQYSGDVAVAVFIYTMSFRLESKNLTGPRIFVYGVLGGLAVWLSHPAVFLLAGIGSVLLLTSVREKDWSGSLKLLLICLFWGTSFAVLYFLSLEKLVGNKFLLRFWSQSFVPFPPISFADFKWFGTTVVEFSKDPLGQPSPVIVVATLALGCGHMFLAKREKFFQLISPLPFLLFASAVHRYPMTGRFLLFLLPAAFIFIAEGFDFIRCRAGPLSVPLVVIVASSLIVYPLAHATFHLTKPRMTEEIKPVLRHVRENWSKGDELYLFWSAEPAFLYYADKFGLENAKMTKGVGFKSSGLKYFKDFEKLIGKKRIWFIFSRTWMGENDNDKDPLLHYLDARGTRKDSFEAFNASAYLYDLSER